jgi:NAD+ kinase
MATVGFFGKAAHPEVEAVVCSLGELALEAEWTVMLESALDGLVEDSLTLEAEEVARQADLAVVLGGDGTMIRAVRMLDDRDVPVFGVNLGFLGYLANFTVEEAAEQFRYVLLGQYLTEKRVRLKASLLRGNVPVVRAKVINDVVVNATGISRIIEIRVEIDGSHVTTYRADGLIVSTPTGSTAYSLSAGGPILAPGTRALVVTPISPHTLTMRPLVVQDDSRIILWVERSTETVLATFDGQQAEPIQTGDRLEIERASGQVLLVRPPRDYFQILRAKLKWGQR